MSNVPRWRKEKRATGLAAVVQGVRGFDLCLDGAILACVRPSGRDGTQWYWHTMKATPYANTTGAPTDLEAAKIAAMSHAKAWMQAAKR